MIRRTKPLQRKTPMKHGGKPVKKISAKRAKDSLIYMQKRKAFLAENLWCEVWLSENGFQKKPHSEHPGIRVIPTNSRRVSCPASTEVHHTKGRTGKNYLDESTWLAVCRENHDRIHKNPSWARAKGFLF